MTPDECVEELLKSFTNYDRGVDIVSAFEFLYTASQTLPASVKHFERFPKVTASDGNAATPDFTVVFRDGTGLAAEIARIARHENSVEKLCKQLLRYDSLTSLPIKKGQATVTHCDVLLLVPFDLGNAPLRRILEERFANKKHWYAPSVAPCIVQTAFDNDLWVFQRPAHPKNGALREAGREAVGKWVEDGIKVQPKRFAPIKAARAFINDSVDGLYLATHLWGKTFATMVSGQASGSPVLLEVSANELRDSLRDNFGPIHKDDIRRTMDLLKTAKFAESIDNDSWQVAWEKPRGRKEREVERVLARRICDPPATSRPARVRRQQGSRPKPGPDALRLF